MQIYHQDRTYYTGIRDEYVLYPRKMKKNVSADKKRMLRVVANAFNQLSRSFLLVASKMFSHLQMNSEVELLRDSILIKIRAIWSI